MTENEAIKNINALNAVCMNKEFYDTDFYLALSLAVGALEKVQQFEAIGTIEDFKALKEKNEPKKVIRPKGLLNEYYHEEECPHCKTEFRVHVVGYKYTQMVGETRHCPNCGQKLAWQ